MEADHRGTTVRHAQALEDQSPLCLVAHAQPRDHGHVDRAPPDVGIRSAHGRLAQALEAQHPAPFAREVAAQWQAAGDVKRFARWAIAAAEEARAGPETSRRRLACSTI